MTEVIDMSKPTNTLKEFDRDALWEKHSYIDMAAGEVVMMVPVTLERVRDTGRKPRFFSSISAARGGRPVQLSFEIEGVDTLAGALDKWIATAQATADEYHRKAEEAEIRSRLTVPSAARMTNLN